MEKQKEEARRAWKGSGEAATETIWFEIKEQTGATEFLGYDTEAAEGEVVALVKDGKSREEHRRRRRGRARSSIRRPSTASAAARSATRA